MSALFCKKQETMNYLKNILMKGLILFAVIYQMHEVLNLLFIYEKKNWHHSFISESKSSNIQVNWVHIWTASPVDLITWKCWYNILWLPLLVSDTIALDNPMKNFIVTCVNELIF